MRVLVAGSTGVIGRQLTPLLQGAGHEVIGMSRNDQSRDHKVVEADALDRDDAALCSHATSAEAGFAASAGGYRG